MAIKNVILVIISVFIGLLISEFGVRMIIGNPYETSGASKRVMLFQNPENFINVGDIFTYAPNESIRSEVYYGKIGEGVVSYRKEYGYNIVTNNLGLVQKNSIKPNSEVHLFLGDSYTEGQGASPWFYKLEGVEARADLPLVNGGLLGTGVSQWELLSSHLKSKYKLKIIKQTVILIGDDIRRPVWNFSNTSLDCLSSGRCDASQEDFFGFDFKGKDDAQIKTESFVLFESKNNIKFDDEFKGNVKKLLKKSALFVNVYLLLKSSGVINDNFKIEQSRKIVDIKEKNLAVLTELHRSKGVKTNFILVQTKWESNNDAWDSSSQMVITRANEEGWDFNECMLLPSDFHLRDTHPNEIGYSKLLQCVRDTSL